MKLKIQKRLAASIMGCSQKRVVFDQASLEDIKEAITKTDIRSLVGDKIIQAKPVHGVARARANKIRNQKRKGLRKGPGKRKGKDTARNKPKRIWITRVRHQRDYLKSLKEKKIITNRAFTELYSKVKGGFFRSKKHINIYLDENKLITKKK